MGEANPSGPSVGERAHNKTSKEGRATILDDGHAAVNGAGGQVDVKVFV